MSLFQCDACGCVENTAACHYWSRGVNPPRCSECDPETAVWHNMFPKESAHDKGYKIGSDGFLYTQAEIDSGSLNWRMQHQGFKIVSDA